MPALRLVLAAIVLTIEATVGVRPSLAQPAACPIGVPACCAGDGDCDDGDACTGIETCNLGSGACGAGTPVVCAPPGGCARATCNPATGLCTALPVDDGTPCDDGDACTLADRCEGGACGGAPRACNDGDPCTDDACDPVDGCRSIPNTEPCDDGDPCTVGERCTDRVCAGGAPRDCDDGEPCTDDTCTPGAGCRNTPNTLPCDDGDACTRLDLCRDGTCSGSDPVVCPDPPPCHVRGTCHPVTGLCSPSPAPTGTPCDDGDACTRVDECDAGACVGREPVVCQRLDACHRPGTCDPGMGTCSDPLERDGALCDDGDGCTVGDRCAAGRCVAVPRSCDDGVPCTADVCRAGECRNVPLDGRCDTGECVLARCRPGAAGADAGGCVGDPVGEGETCTDDGLACTEDRCAAGACRHTAVDDRCATGDPCRPAGCDPAQAGEDEPSGCVERPAQANGLECAEDGDPCTGDACDAGACAHPPVETKGACDPVRPAYERARGLATAAAGVSTRLVGALPADDRGSQAATAVSGSAAALATRYEGIARILAGKVSAASAPVAPRAVTAAAGPMVETAAQQRARLAFVQVLRAPREVRVFLHQLATARQRALLPPAMAGDLRRRGRELLRGTKTLKRDLRRLQAVRRSFAR